MSALFVYSEKILTALPMLAVASIALSTRVGFVLRAKDLVIWDTNSTEMPTACTPHRKVRNTYYCTQLDKKKKLVFFVQIKSETC